MRNRLIERRRFLSGGLGAAAALAATRGFAATQGLGAMQGLAATQGLAAPALVRSARDRYAIFDFSGGQAERAKEAPVADFARVIAAAAESGSPVSFPPGPYPIRSLMTKGRAVSLVSDAPLDFECAPDAAFVAGRELSQLTGSLLGFQNANQAAPGTRTTFRFVGGFFDGSQLVGSQVFGVNMLDVYQYADPLFENVRGYGGRSEASETRIGTGSADTLLTVHNCFRERIIGLKGSGFQDALLYLSGDKGGDVLDGRGEQAFVSGLSAKRCGNGVVIKRDHIGQVIEKFDISECQNGIIGSPTGGSKTNQGKRTHVLDGRLERIQGRPIMLFGSDPLVSGVTIEDFGLWVSDGRTPTATRTGNAVAGIDLRGGVNGSVTGNTVTLGRWAGGQANGRIGVALRRDGAGAPTRACTVARNRIVSVEHGIYVEAGSEDNRIDGNVVLGER